MYACYAISEENKKELINLYPPRYDRVLVDHCTIEYGISKSFPLPKEDQLLKIIGYMNVEGIEAFLVSVNGSVKRPDGKTYHITISLDPTKYKPVDAGLLIADSKDIHPIVPSINFMANPELKY